MIRIFLPLLCAALGFAAASCSQSQGPFGPAEAPASAPPTVHGSAAAAMASPQASSPGEGSAPSRPQAAPGQSASAAPQAPARAPLERRASTLMGMPVVAEDGTPLGEVKDIIFDRLGRATHLVIAYGPQPQASSAGKTPEGSPPGPGTDGRLTAMPWDAALASVKGGQLVLDVAKLQSAPSFTPAAWPNLADPGWSASTDTYWRKAVRAAIAAHPGAPIDSASRRRGSRTRDGN